MCVCEREVVYCCHSVRWTKPATEVATSDRARSEKGEEAGCQALLSKHQANVLSGEREKGRAVAGAAKRTRRVESEIG